MMNLKDTYPGFSASYIFQTQKLNLESTIQELSLYNFQTEYTTLVGEVAQVFKANPFLPGVILTNQNHFFGMISRNCFLEHLFSHDGIESFYKRPIKALCLSSSKTILVINKHTLIDTASQAYLERDFELINEPILVEIEPGNYKILDAHQLLLAHSYLYQLTQQNLHSYETKKTPLNPHNHLREVTNSRQQIEKVVENSSVTKFNEKCYQNLIEASSDWSWKINENAVYTYISPNIEKILGYEAEEIIGKTPFDLMPAADAKNIANIVSGNVNTHQTFTCIETAIIHKDGNLVIIENTGVPYYDAGGRFRGYRGISRNITERRLAEIELRKSLNKEKELNEIRTRFISMASHDFRTPLATILFSTDLLKVFGHQFSQSKKEQYLNKIQSQVKNMTQLLDDVLLIGKAESGNMEFKPVTLNLEGFCREILEEIELITGNKHSFVFKCQRECYEGECSIFQIDPKLLRQILTNLLSNAVKYSPEGGTIQLKLFCQNEQAIFQIKDEGIGIPLEDQERLFDLFHRASNVGNISGTGLGMAIIKQAVELHGGTISFESEVNRGTTFTISIPTSQR
ncbi:MAG: ATP-binding protein [Crinalium sp.]